MDVWETKKLKIAILHIIGINYYSNSIRNPVFLFFETGLIQIYLTIACFFFKLYSYIMSKYRTWALINSAMVAVQ